MNSIYDNNLHIAVPTLDYFRDITGMDYIIESGYDEAEATRRFRSLVLKAKDFLLYDKPSRYQNAFGYLIKNYTLWTHAWEQYVIRYIEATFKYGDEAGWKEIPFEVKNAISGSVLKAYHLDRATYYEIENSGTEW
jgi:hypothetical protein